MFTGLESPTHLIIVLVVVLLFFGAKRVPELAKGLGAGMREFRKGAKATRNWTRLQATARRARAPASAASHRTYAFDTGLEGDGGPWGGVPHCAKVGAASLAA